MDYRLLKYSYNGQIVYRIEYSEDNGQTWLQEREFLGTDEAVVLQQVKDYTNNFLSKEELVSKAKIAKFTDDVNAL